MIEWMILPFKRYFDFKGRSRRMEYWSFALLNIIVYIVLGGLAVATGAPLGAFTGAEMTEMPELGFGFYIFAGLLGLWGLAVIIPAIAVVVRRLHDRDMSGWWYLGLILVSWIPIVGLVAVIAFLVLMFLPGTVGPNRFGPDPKDPSSAEVFS